jgi:hypothetical protein
VEGASLVVTVHLGTSLPLICTSSTIMSQSGGLDHVAHSLMNADDTNSVSSLTGDVIYSVTPYVMTRLTMGIPLSKIPTPPRSDWPHEDYFVSGPLERVWRGELIRREVSHRDQRATEM